MVAKSRESVVGLRFPYASRRTSIGTTFSAYGLTPEQVGEAFGISRQTVYKRVAPLKEFGLLLQTKVGNKTYYTLDLEVLAQAPIEKGGKVPSR